MYLFLSRRDSREWSRRLTSSCGLALGDDWFALLLCGPAFYLIGFHLKHLSEFFFGQFVKEKAKSCWTIPLLLITVKNDEALNTIKFIL